MTAAEMVSRSNGIWNLLGRIPVHQWLLQDHEVQPDDILRLQALGNCVMPACGRLAVHIMAHYKGTSLA